MSLADFNDRDDDDNLSRVLYNPKCARCGYKGDQDGSGFDVVAGCSTCGEPVCGECWAEYHAMTCAEEYGPDQGFADAVDTLEFINDLPAERYWQTDNQRAMHKAQEVISRWESMMLANIDYSDNR